MRVLAAVGLTLMFWGTTLAPAAAQLSSCTFKGIRLYGKVQIVDAFADLKVQVVNAFPDLKVKWVSAFPDACGKWQKVNALADFKIQLVDALPDIKIMESSFPGL